MPPVSIRSLLVRKGHGGIALVARKTMHVGEIVWRGLTRKGGAEQQHSGGIFLAKGERA